MIREPYYHWMVERHHPTQGWVCIFDNSFTKTHGHYLRDNISLYAMMWQFIKDEIERHQDSDPYEMRQFDASTLSSWCQTFYDKFEEHGDTPVGLPMVVHGLLGEDCPYQISQWKKETRVRRFIERCHVMSEATKMPIILTKDTNLNQTSAHEKMKCITIFQGLEPVEPHTVRIAINMR